MPSAKGNPTKPQLKEKVTEEVKQQTNKDGSGKGQMAAWKAAKIGKEYEARGGDYENTPGSKNKPVKGPPQKKSPATREKEIKEMEGGKGDSDETEDEKMDDGNAGVEKGKENGKKEAGNSKGGAKKVTKEPAKGTRSSARQAEAAVGEKRSSASDGQEKEGKKAKTKK